MDYRVALTSLVLGLTSATGLISAGPSIAGSLTTLAQVSGSCAADDLDTGASGPVTSHASCSYAPSGSGVTVTGAASARAHYGVLGVSLGNLANRAASDSGAASSGGFASAISSEVLQISNAPASGFLRMTFRLDGHMGFAVTSAASTTATVGGSLSLNNQVFYSKSESTGAAPSEFGSLVADVPYSDGQATVAITLSFQSQCFAFTTDSRTCHVNANFLHTASVTRTDVLDENLLLVPDAVITSESGFDYKGGAPLADFLSYNAVLAKGSARFTSVLRVPLKDQFDAEPLLYDVTKPARLFTPASANGRAVGDSSTHLMAYAIKTSKTKPPQPGVVTRHVRVSNALHSELLLDLGKATLLLVPTAKCVDAEADCPSSLPAPDPVAHDVDHYKCYAAKLAKGSAFTAVEDVAIEDQFLTTARLFDLKKPVLVCTPVDKDGEGIKDPDRHLVCYKAAAAPRQSAQPTANGVHVSDQFGALTVNVKMAVAFCAPSTKTVLVGVSASATSEPDEDWDEED